MTGEAKGIIFLKAVAASARLSVLLLACKLGRILASDCLGTSGLRLLGCGADDSCKRRFSVLLAVLVRGREGGLKVGEERSVGEACRCSPVFEIDDLPDVDPAVVVWIVDAVLGRCLDGVRVLPASGKD
jgi:hypothetical protein